MPLELKWICRSALMVAALLGASAEAKNCPKGQTRTTLFHICIPDLKGDIGKALDHLKNEARAQSFAPALETWLQLSRNTARRAAKPIPAAIRAQLTGYVPDELLKIVRYKIGDKGLLNFAPITFRFGPHFGQDPGAVTLIDTIVFRDRSQADLPEVWAHEFAHMQQFRRWTVSDFAVKYLRDPAAVEKPAYEVQEDYPRWAVLNNKLPATALQYLSACVGAAGLKGVQFWGPSGVPCNGLVRWGRYENSPRITPTVASCKGHGSVEGVTLWGPTNESCAGMGEDWETYKLQPRPTAQGMCACLAHGNFIGGHLLWGPKGEPCGGFTAWGTYNNWCHVPN